jgi:hypothetical protein
MTPGKKAKPPHPSTLPHIVSTTPTLAITYTPSPWVTPATPFAKNYNIPTHPREPHINPRKVTLKTIKTIPFLTPVNSFNG